MKYAFLFLAMLSNSAFAAGNTVFCRASTAVHISIDADARVVHSFKWQEDDVFKILDVQHRFLETSPSIHRITYKLEDNNTIVVEFKSGNTKGTGYGMHRGKKVVDYYFCSK